MWSTTVHWPPVAFLYFLPWWTLFLTVVHELSCCCPLLAICRPSLAVCRPSLVACRPLLDVCRLLLDVCRPSLDFGCPLLDVCCSLLELDVCCRLLDVCRRLFDVCCPSGFIFMVSRPSIVAYLPFLSILNLCTLHSIYLTPVLRIFYPFPQCYLLYCKMIMVCRG